MDTWWIDEPDLQGCANPSEEELETLRRDGFGVLVSLLDEEEQSPRYDIVAAAASGWVRHAIPVKDFQAPTVEQLEQFVTLVSGLPPGTRTVVHCQGGSGRTGTFAAAYWCANGLSASDAIAHVRKARPHAVETSEQEAALEAFCMERTHPTRHVMHPRPLGRTGLTISPVGLGCWQFSQGRNLTGKMWSVLGQGAMDDIVAAALRGGITWFDTAEAYGDGASERALAAGLRHAGVEPGQVVVATKWLPILKPARDLRRNIGTRNACLAPYPVDLYQVHIPWSTSPVAAQMREMATLVRAGKVRAVGVSNFSAKRMAQAGAALQAEGLPLASNQVRINLLERSVEANGVLDLARERGVTLIAYSPLAQGVLTGRYHDDPAKARALPYGRRSRLSPSSRFLTPQGLARSAPLIAGLRAVGEAHGATPAQVALAWLVTYYGETVVAIPGASRAEQASEAAAVMDLQLTADEVERIDRLSAAIAHR